MKYFIELIEISIPIVSVLQMALFLFAPCTPPFIVSMSGKCRGARTVLDSCRWFGHILDTWILSHGVYSAAIPILFVLCVGTVCFLTYLDILKRYVEIFFYVNILLKKSTCSIHPGNFLCIEF